MPSGSAAQAAVRRIREELEFASRGAGMLDRLNPSMQEVTTTVHRMVVEVRRAIASASDAADALVRVAAYLDHTEQFYALTGQLGSGVARGMPAAAVRELTFALRSAMGADTRPRA